MIGRVISHYLQLVFGSILPVFSGLGFMGLVYLCLLIYYWFWTNKAHDTWILLSAEVEPMAFLEKTLDQFMLGCVFEICFLPGMYSTLFNQWNVCYSSYRPVIILDPPEPQQTLPLYFFRGVSLSWVCKLLRNGDIYHSLPQARHWVSTHPLILQNHTKYLCEVWIWTMKSLPYEQSLHKWASLGPFFRTSSPRTWMIIIDYRS